MWNSHCECFFVEKIKNKSDSFFICLVMLLLFLLWKNAMKLHGSMYAMLQIYIRTWQKRHGTFFLPNKRMFHIRFIWLVKESEWTQKKIELYFSNCDWAFPFLVWEFLFICYINVFCSVQIVCIFWWSKS